MLTQRAIADALGLSQSAVSHALNGTRKVSESTRRQVQEYAKKHGYRVDPALGALAAYRRGKRVPGFQGTVAWATNFSTSEGWRLPPFAEYFEGARDYLERRGFRLDPLWMKQPGMSSARFREILLSRGIEAVLLCPQEKSGTELDDDFADFSVVTFGFSLRLPVFHNVTAHGFASMRELCSQLSRLGHRAIGFIYSRESEERSLGSWIGGLSAAHALEPCRLPVPPIAGEEVDETALRQWYDRYRPDAVISIRPEPLEHLKSFGLRVPEDLSICLTVANHDSGIAGMDFDHRRIGAIAARKLIALYQDRERGVPAFPEVTALSGQFWPGKTVIARLQKIRHPLRRSQRLGTWGAEPPPCPLCITELESKATGCSAASTKNNSKSIWL